MIIVEDKLKAMFKYLPTIKGFNPTFGMGDDLELNTFLSVHNKETTPYPLIWLVYPYKEVHKITSVDVKGMQLVLAVKTTESMLNDQRIEKTYKEILIPLFENIEKLFKKASTIRVKPLEYEIVKFPNYGDEKSKTVDIWDALKVTFDISFNGKCLREIKF